MSARCGYPEFEGGQLPSSLQRWAFCVKESGGKDGAIAIGVLAVPIKGRREQPIMVLRGSLVRLEPGTSDPRRAANDRAWLIGQGAIKQESGNPIFIRDVIFPSFSRAAGVICGRSENGWELWKSVGIDPPITLSEAYDRGELGQFSLIYYDDLPFEAVIVER